MALPEDATAPMYDEEASRCKPRGLRRRTPEEEIAPPAALIIRRAAAAANAYEYSAPTIRRKPRRRQPEEEADPAPWLSKHYASLPGQMRVANATEYRLYATDGDVPVPGTDSPKATSATLPVTWSAPGDGDWYVVITYFNGYLESGYQRIDRLRVAAGVQASNPPSGPNATWYLELRAAGVVRISALYNRRPDLALGVEADAWKIWYTTTGVAPDPDVDPASVTVAMTFTAGNGLDFLQYSLPGQADGTTVKVIIRPYRTAAAKAAENTEVKTAVADAAGPAMPQDGDIYRGRLPEA